MLESPVFGAELRDLFETLQHDGPLKNLQSKGVHGLEVSAHNALHGLQRVGDFLDAAGLLRFHNQNFHYLAQIQRYKSLYDNMVVSTTEKSAPHEKQARQKKKPRQRSGCTYLSWDSFLLCVLWGCCLGSVHLEAMQGIVGGHLQAVYPFRDEVALVCNEEGKNLNLPYDFPR